SINIDVPIGRPANKDSAPAGNSNRIWMLCLGSLYLTRFSSLQLWPILRHHQRIDGLVPDLAMYTSLHRSAMSVCSISVAAPGPARPPRPNRRCERRGYTVPVIALAGSPECV